MMDDFSQEGVGELKNVIQSAHTYLDEHFRATTRTPREGVSTGYTKPEEGDFENEEPEILDSLCGIEAEDLIQGELGIEEFVDNEPPRIFSCERLFSDAKDFLATVIDDSFVSLLFHHLRETQTIAPTIYRRAHLDRRHFSKIISGEIRPSKDVTLALAFALRLDLEIAEEFIGKAGYKLTHGCKRDILIEFCLLKEIYDLNEVNTLLREFNQKPLAEK